MFWVKIDTFCDFSIIVCMLEMFYCDITDSGRVANLRHGTVPAQGFWWL